MRIAYLTQTYFPMADSAAIFASQLVGAMLTFRHQLLVITASDKDHHYHIYKENITIVRLRSIHDPFHAGERLFFRPHRAIISTLRQFQPDIIHVFAPLQAGMSALVYAKQAHIPILITLRDSPRPVAIHPFKQVIEKLYWWYNLRIIQQYDAVLVSTQTTATHITSTARCTIIPVVGELEFSAVREPAQNQSSAEIFKRHESIYLDMRGQIRVPGLSSR